MDKNSPSHHDMIIHKLESLSVQEFLNLGADGLSYIKQVGSQDGNPLYALHSANGSHIATGSDVATLKHIALQNELAPMPLQ